MGGWLPCVCPNRQRIPETVPRKGRGLLKLTKHLNLSPCFPVVTIIVSPTEGMLKKNMKDIRHATLETAIFVLSQSILSLLAIFFIFDQQYI